MSELKDEVKEVVSKDRTNRRRFLAQAGIGAAGLGLTAMSATSAGAQAADNRKVKFNGKTVKDEDILNFALNLEYLEAEFYLRAIGRTLNSSDITGISGIDKSKRGEQVAPGPVIGGKEVPFTNATARGFAEEIAADEEAHVKVLRAVLGSNAVARPTIDVGPAFTLAARAAGLIGPNDTFDAYANEANFLLAAFIFEDVGVTAYKGAAPLIKDPGILEASAGILAVEAYHSGEIRTRLVLASTFGLEGVPKNPALAQAAQAISNLRDAADGPGDKDQGILNDPNATTRVNVVPTDRNAIAFSRSFEEVLRIVYLGGAPGAGGGFFPNGLNGRIR